jgi:hypothetical protein
LNYDPTDDVLVLSRNERPSGFWTQDRRQDYLAYLKRNADKSGGAINQTRVMVHQPIVGTPSSDDLMPASELHGQMIDLHRTDSYYAVPSTILQANYDRLAKLVFGFTLSTKHKYVVIPIPKPEGLDADTVGPNRLSEIMSTYQNYDKSDGALKAIISADAKYVGELEREMRALIQNHATKLK